MPDPSLLTDIEFTDFTLEEVLDTINKRVEVLLDRDHTIGHSYFMKVASGDTEKLCGVFKDNIIPLLQEYFYNDYEKIGLVLGEGFVEELVSEITFAFKSINAPEIEKSYQLKEISQSTIEEAVIKLLLK